MSTVLEVTSPKGIGGWLRLFAFLLCFGFVGRIADLAEAMPDYWEGFKIEAAHGPLIVVGLMALAEMAIHLWSIVALFQRKRALRMIYATLWGLTLAAPF